MRRLIVFSWAGMSAESGLKTFRDNNALWENYKVEDVATPAAWKSNQKMVLTFTISEEDNFLKHNLTPLII